MFLNWARYRIFNTQETLKEPYVPLPRDSESHSDRRLPSWALAGSDIRGWRLRHSDWCNAARSQWTSSLGEISFWGNLATTVIHGSAFRIAAILLR